MELTLQENIKYFFTVLELHKFEKKREHITALGNVEVWENPRGIKLNLHLSPTGVPQLLASQSTETVKHLINFMFNGAHAG